VSLVTLGTHPMPMNRLLAELDRLVGARIITDEVIVQTAVLDYRPVHLTIRPILPYPELVDLVAKADVVVSHAGPGNLATVRSAGKVPVVVPRSVRHGEHVDDHQERYARRLAELPGYVVVGEASELATAIAAARGMRVQSNEPDMSLAITVLEEIIGRPGSLRIAILGTRGVPGRYGGFETMAEELGARLAQRGHEITVYCRHGKAFGRPTRYRGMRLVHLPAIRHKAAETLSHTLLSAMHAATRRFDVVYVCNSANSPICYIPLLRGQKTVLNVDGLEWRRAKWGRLAKAYLRWAVRLAARMPIDVVTDADVIQQYYRTQLSRETRCFYYGTSLVDRGHDAARLAEYGLYPDRYLLYVSRLEPENNALLVVRAYRQLDTDIPLVIVGDAPYAQKYIQQVREAADDRVRFLGYRFGDEYHALLANALVYIQATEVGGTHPALVEALGHRNAVVAHDVPEHREVVGGAGVYFRYRDSSDLARQLQLLIGDPAAVARYRGLAEERARERYGWDAVTNQYEAYFGELISR